MKVKAAEGTLNDGAFAVESERRFRFGLRWQVAGLLFLVTFVNYVDRVSLGALAPLLKREIGWDDAEFGWINFSFALSYALMFPIAGRAIDRIGVKRGLAIGVLVWSLAAAGHAFASTFLGFAVARLLLGLGEATNFPGCIKAVAEWFPKRERALATGVFNTGTNFAAMLQGAMMALALVMGWRAVFVTFGLLGIVWLAIWMRFYHSPEAHPRLDPAEASYIREGREAPAASVQVPWTVLLRHRQAWAFILGKLLTDPVWWFYLTWLPSYLERERHVSLGAAAGALACIYLAADAGSILGGYLPGFLIRRGMAVGRARLLTLLVFALGLPVSALAVKAEGLWTAVALISVATSCHQAWSANLFTVASDAFPRQAVASVVGVGAMCGGIGGLFMNLVAGGMLQWLGSYAPLFLFAGLMHPLAWLAMRWLLGSEPREVALGGEQRIGASPVLLGVGSGLTLAGAALSFWVASEWQAILAATKNSTAAAAGGLASAALIALLGLALVYASRPRTHELSAG